MIRALSAAVLLAAALLLTGCDGIASAVLQATGHALVQVF